MQFHQNLNPIPSKLEKRQVLRKYHHDQISTLIQFHKVKKVQSHILFYRIHFRGAGSQTSHQKLYLKKQTVSCMDTSLEKSEHDKKI